LPHSIDKPAPEHIRVEVNILQADLVLFRVVKQDLFVEFPILNCKVHDREPSEDDVVELVHDTVVNGGTREEGEESKEPDRPHVEDILVEHVAY